jgi:release factor glutamine methyltransferase
MKPQPTTPGAGTAPLEGTPQAGPAGAQRAAAERSHDASPQGAQRTETDRSHDASPQGAQRAAGERSHDNWTVLSLLTWTTDHFASKGIESARLDAECLLAHALGTQRLQLYLDFDKPVSEAERARFRDLVKRRVSDRMPVAHLLGSKEFWSLAFEVGPDVLTPRPETETLVQAGLDRLGPGPATVLDIGTGSGCVALAIASERPEARIIASDVSRAALAVAGRNAAALGLEERVTFVRGSLFEPLAQERFDLVVSNPPYVAETLRQSLAPELAHEPQEALFSGLDGLDTLRELVSAVPARLAPGGAFAVELSPEQAETVAGWCREAGLLDVTLHCDLAGRPRVVAARGDG